MGEAPVLVDIHFALSQIDGNLVSPFVSTRQARLQEYPSLNIDFGGHDDRSRYKSSYYLNKGYYSYARLCKPVVYSEKPDDTFYTVRLNDTWLLMSWHLYKDIRFWPILAKIYLQDFMKQGSVDRYDMKVCSLPDVGSIIRVPSLSRVISYYSV